MNAKNPIEWADEEIAKHEAAIADLWAYKRVEMRKMGSQLPLMDGGSLPPAPAPAKKPVSALELIREGQRTHGAKKRQMLDSISKSWTGLSTAQVIESGQKSGFPDMRVENVSPQLSAYRKNGLLTLNDGKWSLTPKGREYLNNGESVG